MLFTFFAEATGGAVTCVMDRENLVRKIQFPRMVIPMAVVLTACFNLALNLVVVFIFATLNGVHAAPGRGSSCCRCSLVLIVFAAGIAMLLSALYVRYRDIQPIWDVVLQAGVLRLAHPRAVRDRRLEGLLHAGERPALQPARRRRRRSRATSRSTRRTSTARDAIGGAGWLLVPLLIVVATFALGLRIFNREAPRIAEEL